MKVERSEPEFRPITITLESDEERKALLYILTAYFARYISYDSFCRTLLDQLDD